MRLKEQSESSGLCDLRTSEGSLLIPYRILRPARLKRIRIEIDSPDYVTLKVPPRQSLRKALTFLQEHGDWVRETLQKQPRQPDLARFLQTQGWISIGGEKRSLRWTLMSRHSAKKEEVPGEEIAVPLDPGKETNAQIVLFLRRLARKVIPMRALELADQHGLRVHGITVRDQKSRWGSCSETGALSLNWRLLLLPPEVHDHVILHELSHLIHFDHSKDFHTFLAQLDPNAKRNSTYLSGKGNALMRLGRTP